VVCEEDVQYFAADLVRDAQETHCFCAAGADLVRDAQETRGPELHLRAGEAEAQDVKASLGRQGQEGTLWVAAAAPLRGVN